MKIRAAVVVLGIAAVAACTSPAPPPPPPPPPVAAIPPRPLPPLGAAPNLPVPAVGANGVRQTVNAGISQAQTTWNFRSAYNVAALNCLQPQHAAIVVNYRNFLKAQARGLSTANLGVDGEFRKKYGTRYIPPREAYMTQVYNYYALPPTLPAFCDAVLAVSEEAKLVQPADLNAFAARSIPKFEAVFENFYRSYEQYRQDAAQWDARYGTAAGASAPYSASAATTAASYRPR